MEAGIFWISLWSARGIFWATRHPAATCLNGRIGCFSHDEPEGNGVICANGNQHRQQGNFTTTDDSTQSMDDVWFKVDTARTQDTDMLSVSDEIADLPDLANIGSLRSLRQAMVRDDSGQLQTLVQQYEAQALGANRDALLQDILFHWAGVQDLDPASRTARYYGNAIGDARKLAFLEAVLGRGYEGTWCWGERDPNPHGPAAAKLLVLYEQVKSFYGAQLDAQTVCSEDLAAIDITWDEQTQDFVWDVSQVVSQLRTQFDTSPEETVTHLDRLAAVLKSMGSAGETLLRQMQQQGSAQDGDLFGNALRQMGGLQLVFSGTAGNDTLSGNAETNYFYAHAGNDMLSGGEGDDSYYFNAGDGQDVVLDVGTSRHDAIYLGEGSQSLDMGAVNYNLLDTAQNNAAAYKLWELNSTNVQLTRPTRTGLPSDSAPARPNPSEPVQASLLSAAPSNLLAGGGDAANKKSYRIAA